MNQFPSLSDSSLFRELESLAFQNSSFEAEWSTPQDFTQEELSLFPPSPVKEDPIMNSYVDSTTHSSSVMLSDSAVASANPLEDLAEDLHMPPIALPFEMPLLSNEEDQESRPASVSHMDSVEAVNRLNSIGDHSYTSSSFSSGVQDLEQDLSESEDVSMNDSEVIFYHSSDEAEEETKKSTAPPAPAAKTLQPKRKGNKKTRRKPKANAWSLKRQQIKESREKRLYEMNSFKDDPELERCRLNAMSAKLNREKKKREQEQMAADLSKYKRENQKLLKINQNITKRYNSHEQCLARLELILRQNNLEDLFKQAAPCTRHHPDGQSKSECPTCSLGQ